MAQKSASFQVKSDNSEVKAKDRSEQKPADKLDSGKKEGVVDDKEQPEGEGKKSLGLFSNLLNPTSNPPTGGLFGQVQNGANLFNNSNITPNLFQPSSIFQGINQGLFSNSGPSNIFDNSQTKAQGSGGLFGQAFQIHHSEDSEDANEEDQNDEQKSQDEEQKEIIMKYEYQKKTTPIVKFPLMKFRKNNCDVLEKGTIALEKVNDADRYLILYRNNIQNVLYQGQVVNGASKVLPLGQKKENLLVKTISSEEDDEKKKPKFCVDSVKLMFCEASQAIQFKEEVLKIIAKKEI